MKRQAEVSKQSKKQYLLLPLGKIFLSTAGIPTGLKSRELGGKAITPTGRTGKWLSIWSSLTARPLTCTLLPETKPPTAGLYSATLCYFLGNHC